MDEFILSMYLNGMRCLMYNSLLDMVKIFFGKSKRQKKIFFIKLELVELSGAMVGGSW